MKTNEEYLKIIEEILEGKPTEVKNNTIAFIINIKEFYFKIDWKQIKNNEILYKLKDLILFEIEYMKKIKNFKEILYNNEKN